MLNKFGNLHLLILIGAVAVCSLLLIQQNVLAAWQPPSSQPGGTNLDGVVFNPLTQDLDLGGKKITGSSKIIIDPNNGIYSKGIKGVWGVANNPATDLAGYFVGKVNVDDNPHLAAQFGVSSIPTIMVFKSGQPVERIIGVRQKQDYVNAVSQYSSPVSE